VYLLLPQGNIQQKIYVTDINDSDTYLQHQRLQEFYDKGEYPTVQNFRKFTDKFFGFLLWSQKYYGTLGSDIQNVLTKGNFWWNEETVWTTRVESRRIMCTIYPPHNTQLLLWTKFRRRKIIS